MMTQTVPKLVVIDGMGFVFRAYHAVRSDLRRSRDGLPTNALFGFCQMLVQVVNDLQPELCCVALDSRAPTFRHALYPAYKGNRPPLDEALARQLPFLEPIIATFGLPVLRLDGVEADDLIASLVTKARGAYGDDADVTVVTSDKDLLQLVGGKVVLLDTFKQERRGPEAAQEKFGVPVAQVVEVQALMGDSSDNIPGVPGVGPKTAADLIGQFGSVEALYARLHEVARVPLREKLAANEGLARISRQLVELKHDVPLPELAALRWVPQADQAAAYLGNELEFKALAARLLKDGHAPKVAKVVAKAVVKEEGVKRSPPALVLGPEGVISGGVEGGMDAVVAPGQERGGGQNGAQPWAQNWGSYACVQTLEVWQHWLARARATGVLALDTETTSLAVHDAGLVGLALAVAPGEACYVPLAHCAGGGAEGGLFAPDVLPDQLPVRQVLADLVALWADGSVRVVGHNWGYDWQVLLNAAKAAGIAFPWPEVWEDTLLLSGCLAAGLHGHGLDELARLHLQHVMIPFAEVAGRGQAQVTFDRVGLVAATAYAAEDADATLRLWAVLSAQLAEAGDGVQRVYGEIEKPLLPVIVGMEQVGVRVDVPTLRALSLRLGDELATLEQVVQGAAGLATLNVQSPKQLAAVLFDDLKLGSPKLQKARSTAADVLEELAEQTPPDSPGGQLLAALLTHRQLAKIKSTYSEALVQQVHGVTGRVHTHYQQIGAATGRFSSSNPNLQNIPIRSPLGREIRAAFVPEPGWVMASADYSQIELRLLAHLSGSVALTEAFVAGADIHTHTAALIAGKKLDDVTKDERRAAKFVNFGLVYGMGARSLAGQMGCAVSEAERWIAAYFARYDRVKDYMEANKAAARAQGFVETLLGRRVWLPEIGGAHGGKRAGAERAAINAPLQGSNADVIKLAMPKVAAALVGKRARLLLQVHDELVFELPPEEQAWFGEAIPALMSEVVTLRVPLKVEIGFGPNWELAH
jgi:DNA polymerase I